MFHQVATLIASTGCKRVDELLVVLERPHRRAEIEPVRLPAEAPQLDLMSAVEQAVEVLEDVPVAAADTGVLGHVDDAQHAVRRSRTLRASKNSTQRSQKTRCEARSRSPTSCRG